MVSMRLFLFFEEMEGMVGSVAPNIVDTAHGHEWGRLLCDTSTPFPGGFYKPITTRRNFFPGLGNGADRAKEAEKKELGLIRDVLSLQ
jgi:hypothetical protein